MITLELPFPPRELSPNARVFWRKRASIKRIYRAQCYVLALEAMRGKETLKPPVEAQVTFIVPDNRRRDFDNMQASIKALWDALVGPVLEDDSTAMLRHLESSLQVVKGKSGVVVRLRSVPPSETALSTSSRNAEED